MSAGKATQQEGLSIREVSLIIGANVRTARKRAGLSQEETATRAGLNRTAIGLLERGHRMPRAETILKVASGLGVEPGEFFEGVHWMPGGISEAGRFLAGPAQRPVISD